MCWAGFAPPAFFPRFISAGRAGDGEDFPPAGFVGHLNCGFHICMYNICRFVCFCAVPFPR